MIPALSNRQRQAVIAAGLVLVMGSLTAWPTIASSQFAPAASATPDPATLSAYRPEPLPLRDYSHDPDPFRADILAEHSVVAIARSAGGDVPRIGPIAAAPPGVVPDILTVNPAAPGSLIGLNFGIAGYGTVRGIGSDFALIERNGSLPLVRVGDVLGGARVAAITERGVVLSNGVLLTLDTSPATPAPTDGNRAAGAQPPSASPAPSPSASPTAAPTANAVQQPSPPRILPRDQNMQGAPNQ